MEFHAKVEKEVVVTIEERIIDDSEDDDTNLVERAPVVVVRVMLTTVKLQSLTLSVMQMLQQARQAVLLSTLVLTE